MASFSGWNGVKMHGNASLLTGVLKQRWGFDGLVVGDWDGHAKVPGCTPTDCPASIVRRHPDARLFLDEASASLLKNRPTA